MFLLEVQAGKAHESSGMEDSQNYGINLIKSFLKGKERDKPTSEVIKLYFSTVMGIWRRVSFPGSSYQ
jgi:hypothetical protein